jgi:L,D-transpeptidase catalytic domain
MAGAMKRRDIIKGAAATGLAMALPARAFAQAFSISAQHRTILRIAKDQLERNRARVWRTDLVGVADFGLPSSLPRFHFADLEKGSVRSFLVAHGKGSDPEHDGFLKVFSNAEGSNATSRGAFITNEWYKGKYGTSIRLVGVDADNSRALERAIVMHPAWYANADMLDKWGKLGRSDGCFAMGEADFNEALWHLSGGRLLYADRIGAF